MERLLRPHDDLGFLRGDAPDLDRKLREGDGVGWGGDPLLELRQGVVEEMRSGRLTGKIVARRWEVWRHMENGKEEMIGHWRMEEFDRILFDLAGMRVEAPNHVDVIDKIDAANDANMERIWAPGRAKLADMMEHMAKLNHDRNNPRNVFRGMPGRNPDKQM
jgi:hypothetical protein